ncbi:hypothetical protein PUR71_02190 [Streptomyces sp. SP17BM10]|uniref:hypothetical protein n=1 Tax=Streptomyces sp. SP17BM10 TaxID=3002530 RepID=UPI002E797311|nr:hypothetical protein [Streptomyces sp. SP17BM10]MEE1781747.1 hypothetical protein [Streptomyces sp. SP17BM10]
MVLEVAGGEIPGLSEGFTGRPENPRPRRPDSAIMAAMTDTNGPEPLGICLVANVAQETSHGEGGLEIRKGLRHFAPGAKVWIAPPAWGDGGERVIVAGRHRGTSRRYMRIVIERRFLTNFRVRAVYSPALLRALTGAEPGEEKEFGAHFLWPAEQAESWARSWNTPTTQARVEGARRRTRLVADPPPLEPSPTTG